MKKILTKPIALLLLVTLLTGLLSLSAFADGTVIIGEVTVIGTGSVNLRSGGSINYPIIGKASSGQLFQTTGQTSTGWYEILLPDGSLAYVSNGLVRFFPYATPVPVGAQYYITAQYRTAQGQLLRAVDVPVKPGQNVVTADDVLVPGYRLISTRSVYVFVDAAGKAVPSGVIFSYEPLYQQATPAPAVQAVVPVYYRNVFNQVLASEYRMLPQGTHLVRADAGRIPAGYALSGATDAVVIVSSIGTAAPEAVNFILTQSVVQTPRPIGAEVIISYRSETGGELYTERRVLQPGYSTVTADDSRVPAGMSLTSSRSVAVYVSDQGFAYPGSIVFTYRAVSWANVQVLYRSNAGVTLYNETRTLPQGTHTLTADDSRVPSGYVLQGARSVNVTVYANGTASQNQVIFIYSPPVTAYLGIEYRDTQGSTLFTESKALGQGTHTITANDGRVPAGYVLQGARSVQVTVYANGTISQNRVIFLYARPVTAFLNILYRDSGGATLFTETRTLQQGTHTITANDGRAPAGYVLQGPRSVQVTVYPDGSISPVQVVFTYAPPAPPVSVNVPVIYQDQNGSLLHQTSALVSSSAPNKVTADKSLVPAGYVLSGPSSVTVTVSPQGVATPAQVKFTFRDPSTIVDTFVLPAFQSFSMSGSAQPVYSGPGTEYYRAASGKAAVGGGRLRLWGAQGDWALIGYGLSNNLYRIGYIKKSALPSSLDVPELAFSYQTVRTVADAPLNDDPIIQPVMIYRIPAGTEVTLLAYETFSNRWAYIETTFNGQPIRGFVRKENISAP